MAVVKLDRITKVYEGSKESAVKDITFQVDDGEFMVLLGPSGGGKSTILRKPFPAASSASMSG